MPMQDQKSLSASVVFHGQDSFGFSTLGIPYAGKISASISVAGSQVRSPLSDYAISCSQICLSRCADGWTNQGLKHYPCKMGRKLQAPATKRGMVGFPI